MKKYLCLKSFVAVLAISLLANVLYAQTSISTVRGTVRDQQGNLIKGASVTLTNTEKELQ